MQTLLEGIEMTVEVQQTAEGATTPELPGEVLCLPRRHITHQQLTTDMPQV